MHGQNISVWFPHPVSGGVVKQEMSSAQFRHFITTMRAGVISDGIATFVRRGVLDWRKANRRIEDANSRIAAIMADKGLKPTVAMNRVHAVLDRLNCWVESHGVSIEDLEG